MALKTLKPKLFRSSLHDFDFLGLLGVGVYILFTLVPDSSTIVLVWPWVLAWQIALTIPWLWLIKHLWLSQSLTFLRFGLDYSVGSAVIAILGSNIFAPFPQQAIWYAWAALSVISCLYALNNFCKNQFCRTQLLSLQASIASALVILSLYLWCNQTLLPELQRLGELKDAGLSLSFSFSTLELRNWAPFGHQNYVAGYTVLALPLFIGQFFIARKRTTKIWWSASSVLSLIVLFTTSSRGGWLGTGIGLGLGISLFLFNRRFPVLLRLLPGMGLAVITAITLVSNNRLRSLVFSNPFSNNGIDPYRQITHSIGWEIGKDYPVFGAGPGSVPLLFQKYHPNWGGLEAEWHFQLHSTPAQIWAEFGCVGIFLTIAGIYCLAYWSFQLWRSPNLVGGDRIRCWSLLSGLVGYGIVSLTDYQLNIIAIDGTLILYLVCLVSLFRENLPQVQLQLFQSPKLRWVALTLIGFLIAMSFWLAPILRAWQLSSTGFTALQENQIGQFIQYLERSHELAPREPYYLYQLGSQLGKIGLKLEDQELKEQLLEDSQKYFQESLQQSPYLEYGYTNLAWLQLNTQNYQAVQSFTQASRLFPGRKLAFHELGLSLLETKQTDLAIKAFTIEILRNPIWMTSPVWNSPKLKPHYIQVLQDVESTYRRFLQSTDDEILKSLLDRTLGTLYWWQGKPQLAETQWQISKTQFGLDVIAIDKGESPQKIAPILKAWLNPSERKRWVEDAFLRKFQKVPESKQVQSIINNMNQAESLEQWLKGKPLVVYGQRTRTGFGINAGHIDGPPLQDFSVAVNNYAIATFFSGLFDMPTYEPGLDNAIEPLRQELWDSIEKLTSDGSLSQ